MRKHPGRSDRSGRLARFAAFRGLHRGDRPLFLPNAWDFASAAALGRAGHPAVGTTSLGVAASAGRPDGTAATRAETIALTRALGRLSVLLTVDVEAGFGDDPDEVAELVAVLVEAGAVGVNIEDGRADGTLTAPGRHAAKVAAIRARTPEVFVNARTDTFWLAGGGTAPSLAETTERAAAYLAAGADGVFVPGVAEPGDIAGLVAALDAPLNVLYLPGRHDLAELARLGVARVSTGSLLYRSALGAAVRVADAIRHGRHGHDPSMPTYPEVQALLSDDSPPFP